jgi:two-component system phosphate regulon sensor histidine kinase PhoR
MTINLTPRTALALFMIMLAFLLAQAVWWVVFMARLVDEKVELAEQLGAAPDLVEQIHQEEISRQIMVGLEGVVFLLVLLAGTWLIYRSLVKLQELKFHQENFLLAVTHELKTPLSSIKIYLDSLQSGKIQDEKKRVVLPKMKQDVRRLEKLVENVLEAGRFERSGYKLNREWFDLSALVRERLELLQMVPTGQPVELHQDLQPGLMFYGDKRALGRALDAILENSLRYNDSERIRVDVGLGARDGGFVIDIADNGIGLEKKDLKLIFERFSRLGSELTRRSEGSGLGLYLCREIVRAHGGDVTACSRGLGKGTRLTITLKKVAAGENNTAG